VQKIDHPATSDRPRRGRSDIRRSDIRGSWESDVRRRPRRTNLPCAPAPVTADWKVASVLRGTGQVYPLSSRSERTPRDGHGVRSPSVGRTPPSPNVRVTFNRCPGDKHSGSEARRRQARAADQGRSNPGSRTSRTRQLGVSGRLVLRNSWAVLNACGQRPIVPRSLVRASHIDRSSPTITRSSHRRSRPVTLPRGQDKLNDVETAARGETMQGERGLRRRRSGPRRLGETNSI
jgi:hypothetical protein